MLNRRCAGVRNWHSLLRFLILAGIAYGFFSVAVAQSYGAYRPLGPQHRPATTAAPNALQPQTAAAYPGSRINWKDTPPSNTLPMPYSVPNPPAPMHGYKFRDMPGLPTAQDYLPKFRPDRQTGRPPSNWGRDNNPWELGYGGPPPIFRPLEDGAKQGSQSAAGGGMVPGWGGYSPAGEPRNAVGNVYYPGRMGFKPLFGE